MRMLFTVCYSTVQNDGFRRCVHMLALIYVSNHYGCKIKLFLKFIVIRLSGCILE